MRTNDPPVNDLDLRAEAVLDPAIQFSTPLAENWSKPKSIFLTGATGFLGAYLLDELLQKTTANIYCLIRCSDTEAGKQRVKSHLKSYSIWNERFSSRIIPVIGDLSKLLLGLSEEQFSELANRIDVIYHNGALVNYICPYSTLKASNVLGTEEVLRLASLTQTKPVHFVSSVSVFFSQAHPPASRILETDDPKFHANLKGGYKQSKWVAEKLVVIAQERGLPVSIYRSVRIMGHSKTGITGNFHDLLCKLLKGCVQLGKFPASASLIDMVPVDYVSQAIVHLSQQEQSLGKAFHLLNPQPISLSDLFAKICAISYPLDEIAYDEWMVELERQVYAQPENELFSFLLLLLSSPNNLFAKKPQFDDRQTLEGLAGTSIACPTIDKKLVSTYFSYFQKSGYIPVLPTQSPLFEKSSSDRANQSQSASAPSDFWKSIRNNVRLQNQSPAIKPVPRNGNLPLAFGQERLWLIDQLQPGNPVHNLRVIYRLQGALNVAALEKSLQEIVRRHEILRTTFPTVDGQPVQVISPELTLKLPMLDFGELPTQQQQAEVRRLAIEEAQQSFDLERGPLLRVKLLRLAEEEHMLVRTIHHIINDVWSDTVFMRELAVLYEAFSVGKPSPLPELPIQYADFAQFQRQWLVGGVLQSQLDYWKQQLSGTIPVLQLPTDFSPPTSRTYRGTSQFLVLSKNLTKALKTLSQREGVSLFVTLLAAFKTWLYQYSGQEDIIVCSPLAGRNRVETKKLLGYFSNLVLLRTDFGNNPSFRELVSRVSQVTLGAQEHPHVPFQLLANALGIPSATLSRTMFTLQNVPSQPGALAGISVSLLEMEEGIANFDLSLSMKETEEQLSGVVRYKTGVFKESTITRMLENFERLVADIVADSDRHLSDLPLLAKTKPHQVFDKLPEIACIAPQKEIEQTIAAVWEEVLQVEKIGIHANFFDVGGRSLAMIQVYSKLREILDCEISVVELFKYPTISRMGNYLSKADYFQKNLQQMEGNQG